MSGLVFDNDIHPENLFEEVRLRLHRHALDGAVLEARQADVDSVGADANLDFSDALGVSSLKCIRDSKDGGEF